MLTLEQAQLINDLIAERARVRHLLRDALRTGSAHKCREAVVQVLADFGSGTVLLDNADTIPCPAGPDFEPDSAPSVPLDRPSGGA